MMKIRYRFPKFHLDWKEDEFKGIFDFHQTNTFSRSQMNNRRGLARNIHYGDILTKYGNILNDLQEVPYINKDISLLKVKEESYLQNGDIIIADTAEDLTVGKAMEVQNIDGKILSGLHTILCRPKFKFAPRFLGYNLNSSSYRRNLIPLVVGVKVCSISKTNISKTLVMYPDDINEQQKIADCLSSIDDLIFAEEKKLSLLNDYKKGWIQKLFPAEGKTVPEWRFLEFKDDNNWKCVEIETVGKVITGKTPPTSNASLWNGSIQFVTPTDIVGDKYQRLVQRTVVKTSNMKVLPRGTIMFTCIASIGKMAISVYPCVTNQQINSIITKKGYYNEFIYYSLFRNVNKIKSGLSNTTVSIINKTDFSKIQISIALNEKEQEKIANFLSGVDDLISRQIDKIEALKKHKKALMQGLFPVAEEVWK